MANIIEKCKTASEEIKTAIDHIKALEELGFNVGAISKSFDAPVIEHLSNEYNEIMIHERGSIFSYDYVIIEGTGRGFDAEIHCNGNLEQKEELIKSHSTV